MRHHSPIVGVITISLGRVISSLCRYKCLDSAVSLHFWTLRAASLPGTSARARASPASVIFKSSQGTIKNSFHYSHHLELLSFGGCGLLPFSACQDLLLGCHRFWYAMHLLGASGGQIPHLPLPLRVSCYTCLPAALLGPAYLPPAVYLPQQRCWQPGTRCRTLPAVLVALWWRHIHWNSL